jgi:hypothetical protein
MIPYHCEICGKLNEGFKKTAKYCRAKPGQSKSKCAMIAIRQLEKERDTLKQKQPHKHYHSQDAGYEDVADIKEQLVEIKRVEIESLFREHNPDEVELDANLL